MFLLLLALFLLSLVILFYKRNKQKKDEFWKHLEAIPGPKCYPVVGTNYQLLSSESQWLMDRQRSKDYYPVYRTMTLNIPFVGIMDPEDIELVLNSSKHNTKSRIYNFMQEWLGTGLLTSGGEKWTMRRKLLTPAFHFKILQEYLETFNNETKILVENLKKLSHQPYVEVIQPLTEFTLYSVGETTLGIPLREDPKCAEYKQAVNDFGESFAIRRARPWLFIPFFYKKSKLFAKNAKIVKTLHDFSSNVIEEKRKINSRDASYSQGKKLGLLDLMLKAKNEGVDIDDNGIREELDTFIFAGHDTTSVSICHTLMLIASHQEIQEEIYRELISVLGDTQAPSYSDLRELKFMERCIKESLRLYPSVPIIARVAGEDIRTKTGYVIPKGCNVTIYIYDMHRRPEIWEDPEKFDPDRFLTENVAKRHAFAYLPFSAGIRNCIGKNFAICEIKAALCGILRNFKLEPYDRPEHMRFKTDLVLRTSDGIRIIFKPRN